MVASQSAAPLNNKNIHILEQAAYKYYHTITMKLKSINPFKKKESKDRDAPPSSTTSRISHTQRGGYNDDGTATVGADTIVTDAAVRGISDAPRPSQSNRRRTTESDDSHTPSKSSSSHHRDNKDRERKKKSKKSSSSKDGHHRERKDGRERKGGSERKSAKQRSKCLLY